MVQFSQTRRPDVVRISPKVCSPKHRAALTVEEPDLVLGVLSFMQLTRFGFAMLLMYAFTAPGCDQYIPGVFPTRVAQVHGTLQATAEPAWRTKVGERSPVAHATILLSERTDKKFVRPSPDDPSWHKEIIRRFTGAVKHYECGRVVARTRTDKRGAFLLRNITPGSYCLLVTPTPSKAPRKLYKRQFAVDVVKGAPEQLLADITPLNADCSGGGELRAISK